VSDEQPALDDGDLRLRPWTVADVEATRALHDAEIGRWCVGVGVLPPSSEDHLEWVERTRAEWSDSRRQATFVVEWQGAPVGSVDLRRRSPGVGVLSWLTYAPYRGRGFASRAVRLLVDWAFSDLALRRVEAEVSPLNRASLHTALRAGLRREGLLRGNTTLGGEVHDTVVLGRLVDDPAPGTREGFTAMLDSVLPTKRVIGQGLIRDPAGAVLLCEPVYKRDWDLPGGVVDPGEPPRDCVAREIREELALEVSVGRLLATNWLAPWLGWGDAVLFVYEVAMPPAAALARIRLLQREIRAVHWVGPHELSGRVAPYNERMLSSLAAAVDAPLTLELADGRPVADR
jgi:RimJ/RimL family protein N-acetyltransferase/8-oxo-dGTP pyrophosphatase MutT (NUDIX family)